MKKSYLNGVLACLIATLSWGGMFPVMTSALRHIDPFTFTALRYSIAGLAFVGLLVLREGVGALSLRGERIGLAWFLGSCGFAGFGFLVFLGQKLAGPGGALTASITMATMPMLGLLVNWVVRGSRPPLFSFTCIAFSFAGVVLVLTKGHPAGIFRDPSAYLNDLPILVGALCWVIYTVGASFFPKWSPVRYTAMTTLLGLTTVYGVVLCLLATGTIVFPTTEGTLAIVPHLLYMALVAGMVGVLAWNIGNKILTPMNGVLFMDVVPVTAFSISVLLGVVPGTMQLAGAGMTATALVVNNMYQRRLALRREQAAGGVALAGKSIQAAGARSNKHPVLSR